MTYLRRNGRYDTIQNIMKTALYTLALIIGTLAGTACGGTRLLYWNIQDGMWDGQTDNFNRFV